MTSSQQGINIEQDNFSILQGKLYTESLLILKHVSLNFIGGTSEGHLITARNYAITIHEACMRDLTSEYFFVLTTKTNLSFV